MPLFKDRVLETTTTVGTGNISLEGAKFGYRSFSSVFTAGDLVYYCIALGSDWEVGSGIVNAGSPWTLARTNVLASSNSNAVVNFPVGTKDIFCTAAADGLVRSVNGFSGDLTASQILDAVKSIDGSGSGLNADLLDGNHAAAFSLSGHTHNYQPIDGDLTAISELTGSVGLLKKTGTDTWVIDTNPYTTNLGTVTSVTGTSPIISTNGTTPVISIAAATVSTSGSMSAADKTKLDAISGSNTGDQTTIIGNAGSATVLQTARTINGVSFDGSTNITINAVDSTPRVASSLLGVANGVATLDNNALIPNNQLPSYVDDVLEFPNLAGFPATGVTGKIYVAIDTNKTYRWSGTVYIYITSGAVDSVAGKSGIVNLVKADVGLGNVDNTADSSKSVSHSVTSDSAINIPWSGITSKPTTRAGYGITDAAQADAPLSAVVSSGILAATLGLPVMVNAATDSAAAMTFHRPGQWAANFGIDTDNLWKVGGYSMGVTSYPIYHAGYPQPSVSGSSGSCIGNALTATSTGILTGLAHTNGGDGWFRSDGNAGWYSETYGVGIYATSVGVVKTYNGSSFEVTGPYLYVGGGYDSSYIFMADANEGRRGIHCNSNMIGFLNQAEGWGAYCDDAGNWYANNISGVNTGDQVIPTTLPASDVYAWAKASVKPTYTKAEVGLGNVDNTADSSKSVSYANTAGEVTAAFGRTDTASHPVAWIANNSNKSQLFSCAAVTIQSSTGNLNATTFTGQKAIYGPNSSWGAYLQVGGNGREYVDNASYASVCTSDGNLHMDAASGHGMYLNFYDGDVVNFGNGGGSVVATVNSSGVFTGTNFSGPGTGLTGTAASLTAGAAHNADRVYPQNSSADGHTPGHGLIPFYQWGGTNTAGSFPTTSSYLTGFSVGSNPGDQAYGFQVVQNMWDDDIYTRRRDAWIYRDWKKLLNHTNYNSYAPTLTGGGASGTWGINITGNAATVAGLAVATGRNNAGNQIVRTDANGYLQAGYINSLNGWNENNNASPDRIWGSTASDEYLRTYRTSALSVNYANTAGSADNIDGWAFVNTGSNNATNADSIASNGISYYASGVPNFSGNATDGALYSQVHSGGTWEHQIAGDYRSGQIALRGKNNGTWQSWRTVIDSGNIGSQSVSYANTAGTATDSTKLPLTGGTMSGTATMKRVSWVGDGGDSGNYFSASHYSMGQDGGGWTYPYPDLIIGFHTGIRIGAQSSYGGTRFYNNSPSTNNSGGEVELFSIGNGDNNVRVADTIYAAHYRGNANVGGTGEAIHCPAGIYSQGTNWLYGPIYTDNNNIACGSGSVTASQFIGNATRANRANGNFYIDDNYGNSIVGAYNSYKYQGVFAMGDSYKLPADGTSTGSLYGIAWSHPNAGGIAGNLSSHGALIIQNGGFLAAISGSIRCVVDMRAPIFYDSNDTGYYCDPADFSNFNGLTLSNPIRRTASVAGFLEGTYNNVGDNGSKSNPIYTIGSSYNPIDNGLSNMYGIGFSHSSFFGDAAAGGWGLYVADNGAVRSIIGASGSWFNGSVRAPIFYDSNDTGYYCDPNGTTRLNVLNVVGNLTGSGTISGTNFIGPGTGLTGTAASLTAGAAPWSGITGKPNIVPYDSQRAAAFSVAFGTYGTISGIKIKLPFGMTGQMVIFTVRMYQSYQAYDIQFSGYLYSTPNNWYEPRAIMICGSTSILVKMGRDSDGTAYVWVNGGEYTGAAVFDVVSGYAPGDLNIGWSITDTAEGSLVNVAHTATVYPTINAGNIASQSVSYADTAGSASANGGTSAACSGNAASATKLLSQGNYANADPGATRGPSGLNLYSCYDNGYPITFGNVLHIGGSGAGQLLVGWSGSDGAHEANYIRSKRDNDSGAWSPWAKIWTDANLTNPGSVKTVSIVTANGISGTVETASTTPAITLTLGAITPTSVRAIKNDQANYNTAGIISQSSTGDVYIGLHASGASAATIKHTRGVNGISILDSENNLTSVTASTFNGTATYAQSAGHVEFYGQNGITPNITSNSNIWLETPLGRVMVTAGPFQLWHVNNAQQGNIAASPGDMIYNTEANKFRGWNGSSWVDFH